MGARMYTEKQIEKKCYQLKENLEKEGFFVKVYENPGRFGHDVAIYKSKKSYQTEPALGEFFLEDTIAGACFENNNCSKWEELLNNIIIKSSK